MFQTDSIFYNLHLPLLRQDQLPLSHLPHSLVHYSLFFLSKIPFLPSFLLPLPKEQAFATVVLLPFVVLLSDNRSQKRNKLPDYLPAQYHFCHRFSLWQP